MLTLHRTVREIDAKDWDSVAGENAFATHRWLLTVETCCRVEIRPLYFTLQKDNSLVAAAVCYVMGLSTEMETLDDMLLGRLKEPARRLGLRFLPAVVCGPLLGYGFHIGVHARLGPQEANVARRNVLDAIEAEARRAGLQVAFAHVLDDEPELKELLRRRKYLRCRNAPLAVLDLPWETFDEYIESLSRKRRGEFRRQISRNQEAGNTIAITECSVAEEGRLIDLVDRTARKHNAYPFAFGKGFLQELKRNAGSRAWLVTARKAEEIKGVCVALEQGQAVFPFAIGVEEEQDHHEYTYFQLGYYSMIRHAIDAGMRRIYYGRGMYQVKLRRGCHLMNTWIYSQESGPRRTFSAPWFLVASLWNFHKLPAAAKQSLRSQVVGSQP